MPGSRRRFTATWPSIGRCLFRPGLIPQFPPGQLDEDVFEVGGAVDVAQAFGVGELGQQVARFAAVEEGGSLRTEARIIVSCIVQRN